MRISREDRGFSLIEVLTTCVLLSALLLIGAMPFANWVRHRHQQDTVRQVVAQLRSAQTRAMAEGTSYRVDIAADGLKSYKVVGGTAGLRGSWETPTSRVQLTEVMFRDPSTGVVTNSVWFLPRGIASDGSLQVALSGSETTYSVDVEGLTSRVSYDD